MSFHNQPITWWGRIPVYVTTIVTAMFLVGVILSTILMAAGSPLLKWLTLSVPLNEPWSLWQCLTYPFIEAPSFFTPFGLMFFYSSGVSVETHLGRASMIRLLVILTLTLPTIYYVLYFIGFGPSMHNGNYLLLIGLLVTMGTLYPHAEMLGWVPMKWVVFVCLIFGSLMAISGRHWADLIALWGTAVVAYGFVRHAQGRSPWEPVSDWVQTKRSGLHVVQPTGRKVRRSVRKQPDEVDPRAEVDLILDKISRTGIGSLTDDEKAKLEAASRRMQGNKKA